MIIKEIDPHGYGMAFIPVPLFLEKAKVKKIRSAKFLSFFNKNMDIYFEFIKDGVIVPFNKIVSTNTPVFISVGDEEFSVPNEYKEIFCYKDFFVNVGSDEKLSLMSFSTIDNKDILKKGITTHSYKLYLSEEVCHTSIDFEIPKGEWFFTMYGLRKKELSHDEEKYDQGYAYGFHFYKSDECQNNNLEKCDDDKYDFGLHKQDE